jgi:hypothetical protein
MHLMHCILDAVFVSRSTVPQVLSSPCLALSESNCSHQTRASTVRDSAKIICCFGSGPRKCFGRIWKFIRGGHFSRVEQGDLWHDSDSAVSRVIHSCQFEILNGRRFRERRFISQRRQERIRIGLHLRSPVTFHRWQEGHPLLLIHPTISNSTKMRVLLFHSVRLISLTGSDKVADFSAGLVDWLISPGRQGPAFPRQ